ncbi:MAG TPA: tRNA epoxyqueuosine(34) reductase QueG [Candidatus Angelobacter sp.]|nr:tRNA epoxyqueuosine(34) reductase QueG [Candidatus Angelobacter sp.]
MTKVMTREQLSQEVRQAASAAGFDLAGIAPVREEDFPEIAAFVEWIEAGYAGEMKYLGKRTESGHLRRASAGNAAPWAKSVVVCAMNYNTAHPRSTEVSDPARGWISRYAWGSKDYHDALMPRLEQVEAALRALAHKNGCEITTRRYVDTGPILERVYARYAGIGWIGKNTCIINQQLGSWLFLGVILTSLEFAADLPAPDRCGSCTRCLDACPTQAFVAAGKLDASRCIAYLTIEKRGAITEELRAGMGHQLFGCDICQDVCPWNRKPGNARASNAPEFQPQEGFFHPDLRWLAGMKEEDFRGTFRGSPIKRTKFSGLRRNLAVAMGNSGNREFLPVLEAMSGEDDPVVAEHARWAIAQLTKD